MHDAWVVAISRLRSESERRERPPNLEPGLRVLQIDPKQLLCAADAMAKRVRMYVQRRGCFLDTATVFEPRGEGDQQLSPVLACLTKGRDVPIGEQATNFRARKYAGVQRYIREVDSTTPFKRYGCVKHQPHYLMRCG